MDQNNKTIMYIIGAVVVIAVIIFIYRAVSTKQNFEKIKHNKHHKLKSSKHNMYRGLKPGELTSLIVSSVKTDLKEFQEKKKHAEIIFKMGQEHMKKERHAIKQRKLRALNGESAEGGETTTPEPLTKDLDEALKRRLKECTLGRIYYLPDKNLEDSTSFVRKDRRSVFKDFNRVGTPDANNDRNSVLTIGEESFNNGFITATRETSKLEGSYSFSSNTRDFTQSISNKTTASAGAAYSAVSVKATASQLTEKDFSSEVNVQAYNIVVRKFSQTITLNPAIFIEEFLTPDLLNDLSDLGRLDLDNSVKSVLDDGVPAGTAPVILTGSETPEQMNYFCTDPNDSNTCNNGGKIPNTHIDATSWAACKSFFSKWGSHVITSIDYGKKVNIWDTITSATQEQRNLLEDKMCLQLSYAGYTECSLACGESYKMNYRENYEVPSDTLPDDAPMSDDQLADILDGMHDEIDSGDVDKPFEPVPAETSAPTTPEGSTTTTTTAGPVTSPGAVTTPSSGGGGSGKYDCDPCGAGKSCVGYQKETKDRPEIMGQCQDATAAAPKFSAGASVCNAKKQTDIEKVSSMSTVSKVFLSGGSSQNQAQIMSDKIGGKPGIDQTKLTNFLTSDESNDVAINFNFRPIWSILIEIFNNQCGESIAGVGGYVIQPLRSKCTAYLDPNVYMKTYQLQDYINQGKVTLGSDENGQKYPIKIVFKGSPELMTLLENNDIKFDSSTVNEDVCANNGPRIDDGRTYKCTRLSSKPWVYFDANFVSSTSTKWKNMTTPPPSQWMGYYNVFYVDTENKQNRFELYVPENEIIRVYDSCNILQAANNLEAAYVADIVCPYNSNTKDGIYQKMIPLNVLGGMGASQKIQKYACWNKVTGCQRDEDCIGDEVDETQCHGFWTRSCDDKWESCQQGGLWHEPEMSNFLNGPNATPKNGIYRTVAVRPEIVPTHYKYGAPSDGKLNDPSSTDNRKFAQTSCLSLNSRFFPDGTETGKSRPNAAAMKQARVSKGASAKKCYCQNAYIPNLPNNIWNLDKDYGAPAFDTAPPNILPNRLVWNQALGSTT